MFVKISTSLYYMKQLSIQTIVQIANYEELNAMQKQLIDKAKEITKNSYSPYSQFKVGVSILLSNDEIIVGTNQENAAYPSSLCAERTAMYYANSTYPNSAPLCIAIAAYYEGKFKHEPIAPCGACRQVLLESEIRYNQAIEVLLYGEKHIYIVKSIRDLLPINFAPDSLIAT